MKLLLIIPTNGNKVLHSDTDLITVIHKDYNGYSRGMGEFIDKVVSEYWELIETFEYISFMGDDCIFEPNHLLEMANWPYYQLSMTRDSFYSWTHLLKQDGSDFRYVPFIEINCVMSLEFLQKVKAHFKESKSAWGYDYLFADIHKKMYNQYPVCVDTYSYKHTKPVESGKWNIDGKTPWDDMKYILDTYNLWHYRKIR